MKVLKVGFDIGGVISRFPEVMKAMISTFAAGGHEVYVVTDMSPPDALQALVSNGVMELGIDASRVISCNWSAHGDMCKTIRVQELGLDVMFDDRLDYIHQGAPVSFMLVPRPDTPYYHADWKNTSSLTQCVPVEEYEAFKAWKNK